MSASSTKKPDAIVFNEESQRYDAALKPYATGVGAPRITTPDTVAWKKRNVNQVNHHVNTRYEEIKRQYEALMEEYEYNRLILNAKISFEPIVGATYFLYRRKDGEVFLSIIAPHETTWDFVGAFSMNSEMFWKRMDETVQPTDPTQVLPGDPTPIK